MHPNWIRLRENQNILIVVVITVVVILLTFWISAEIIQQIGKKAPSIGFVHLSQILNP
jgi:hypothetical protein